MFDGVDVDRGGHRRPTEDAPNYPPSAWLEREDWPFPVMADSPTGTAAEAYGLTAYPVLRAGDADGKVAGRGTR